jgi:choline dehydrogenase
MSNISVKWGPSTDYKIRDLTTGPNSPDIEIIWFPLLTGDFTSAPPKGCGLTVGAINLRSEGSGTITLKSPSIYDQPIIDHK